MSSTAIPGRSQGSDQQQRDFVPFRHLCPLLLQTLVTNGARRAAGTAPAQPGRGISPSWPPLSGPTYFSWLVCAAPPGCRPRGGSRPRTRSPSRPCTRCCTPRAWRQQRAARSRSSTLLRTPAPRSCKPCQEKCQPLSHRVCLLPGSYLGKGGTCPRVPAYSLSSCCLALELSPSWRPRGLLSRGSPQHDTGWRPISIKIDILQRLFNQTVIFVQNNREYKVSSHGAIENRHQCSSLLQAQKQSFVVPEGMR